MTEPQKSVSRRIGEFVEHSWYADAPWLKSLRPLARVFASLAQRKKTRALESQWQAPVPVIVVGNISVGGTGKTPLVIAIAEYLVAQGYRPGIVSRGYRSHAPHYPFFVEVDSTATTVGDEPLLIRRRSDCPVVIGADRVAAAQHLLAKRSCDVIISDDGLQHYALARAIEICVVDGQRGLGNQQLLPEGPLRESVDRLASVDMLVINGDASTQLLQLFSDSTAVVAHTMQLRVLPVEPLNTQIERRHALATGPVHAVAGIGNPQRFFAALSEQGFAVTGHSFPDHHEFQREDFQFDEQYPILMTEKDAVKCQALGVENAWYQPIEAQLPELFWQTLDKKLQAAKRAATKQAK